jgi:NAD(P)-dependent dehydrogenase (short-subunit alcohol dehydrogenase family)
MRRAEGKLEGRSAVVTGAGRGIGRSEALLLAREGASVTVSDVDADAAAAVADEIRASGGSARVHVDDVASWRGAEALVESVVDADGRLDVLVNNAGILRDAMSFSMTEQQWDDVIRVHLKGHFAPTHFAAAHWRERAKAGERDVAGRVIDTVSEAGLYGLAGQANYVAGKAGIAALTIALARELAKYGVTVNAIAPRARTRMTETVLGDLIAEDGGFDEWDPDNVAPVVAWLASEAAADVTGQMLVVAGDKVHLMSGWTRVGRIDNGGQRWTVEELEARRAELFGEHGSRLPEAGFGE